MKVVFLDRDGVINKDSAEYIKSWDEFSFLPGSLTAIRKLHENGFSVIVITNQSVIGRNMVSPETLSEIFANMAKQVEQHGGKITDVFFCPHHPQEGCECRKPKPGLLLEAAKRYGLDLAATIMIGDSEKDMKAAKRAGCGLRILVRTGNGPKAWESLKKQKDLPDFVADDLLEAVDWTLGRALQ